MKKFIALLFFLSVQFVVAGEFNDSRDLKATFEAVHQIRSIAKNTAILALAKDDTHLHLGEESWPEPNPCFGRTKQGLILHMEKDYPYSLETPWGEVMIYGVVKYNQNKGDEVDFVIKTFCQNLKLKRIDSKLYEVESVNGKLMQPLLLTEEPLCTDALYKSAKTSWQTMMRDYKNSLGAETNK